MFARFHQPRESFLNGTEIWHEWGWGMGVSSVHSGVCVGRGRLTHSKMEESSYRLEQYSVISYKHLLSDSPRPPLHHNDSVHNGRYKHQHGDKLGPKISCDKVKDAVSPKAKRKTSACAASSLPVNVKSSPPVRHSCLLLPNAKRSRVRKGIHNTHRPLVSSFFYGIMCSLVSGLSKIPSRNHLQEENTHIRLKIKPRLP